MQKTKVINATGTKIFVKMSNNGIITKLINGEVESGGWYTISIDPNATFREYWCAGTNPQNKAILSSDDCAEFREVRIVKDDTVNPPPNYWRGTRSRNPRRSAIPTNAPGPTPANDAKSRCVIL